MGVSSHRKVQVALAVRNALAKIFIQGRFWDLELENITISITQVDMSNDLKIANCYLTPPVSLQNFDDEFILERLNGRRSSIRYLLNQQLQLRYSPELHFFYDKGFSNALAISQISKLTNNGSK